VDLDAFDTALSGWLTRRLPDPPPGRMRVVALDGKTARGARTDDGTQVHLLAVFAHTGGVVLGQTQVSGEGGKSSEITAFAPLLDRIDVTEMLLTADALHTQRGHADYLHARGGVYLLIAKANQPTLHAQLVGLPWAQIPVVDEQHERGHGRVEHRGIKITSVGAGMGFPHARLAVQIVRRRRPIGSTRWSSETVYAITSLPWRQARADLISDALRGHWRIEALHWIRDVTFGEDLSQIRTGNGPAVMATLRNFAVSRHHLADDTNMVDTNRAAARVSAALRDDLVELGRVAPTGVALGREGWQGVVAGVGDLVQARRNGWELVGFAGNIAAPLNADTFRVTALRRDGGLTVAPIVRRHPATDDEAATEELGAPVQLSPAYVAADLTLAYASTVHAAEGRTVDTTHSVTGATSSAAGLLVQLTRGREANNAWVITRRLADDAQTGETFDVHARTPQAVLAGVLETAQEERSALAERERAEVESRSTMTHVDQLIAVARAGQHRPHLRRARPARRHRTPDRSRAGRVRRRRNDVVAGAAAAHRRTRRPRPRRRP
jgi:predicted transposase YbfD/YdcC